MIRASSTLAVGFTTKMARLAIGTTLAERLIGCMILQETLVRSLRCLGQGMCDWRVAPPYRLGISLLGIQGWTLWVFNQPSPNGPYKQASLQANPITISSFDDFDDPQESLRQ